MSSLAELLYHTVDGVFAIDAKQRVTFWNHGCSQLFGVPAEQAVGRLCDEVVKGEGPPGHPICGRQCRVARLGKGEKAPKTFALLVRDGNGEELRLSVSIVLVPAGPKDSWTCVHLLHREAAVNVLGAMDHPRQQRRRRARGAGDRRRGGAAFALTTREQEVLELLAEGLATPMIAEFLNIRLVTVRNHLQHIQEKLGVHSQAETVAYAYRHHLV